MRNIFFILGSFLVFNSSCIAQERLPKISSEGVINYHAIRYFIPEPSDSDDVRDYNYQLWYLDSAVIIEFISVEYDFLITDVKRPSAILKTKKFVYCDLKTLLCQDYLAFDTSAIPITNYKLKSNEAIQWRFHLIDTASSYSNRVSKLSDTIIKKKRYSRFLYDLINDNRKYSRIVYLTNDYHDNLFHISLHYDKQNSPLKLLRQDDYYNGKLNTSIFYEQTKIALSSHEKAIFHKWELNALYTKLPVLTREAALKKTFQSE